MLKHLDAELLTDTLNRSSNMLIISDIEQLKHDQTIISMSPVKKLMHSINNHSPIKSPLKKLQSKQSLK